MTRTGACASPWSPRKSLPLLSYPQISYLPSRLFPCLLDTRIRVSTSQQLPSPVSGKKGALVAIPWLPKSLQVLRQMVRMVMYFALLLYLPCYALYCYGYVAVGCARLRQGAERNWSNPNGQIQARVLARKDDRGRQGGSGQGGPAIDHLLGRGIGAGRMRRVSCYLQPEPDRRGRGRLSYTLFNTLFEQEWVAMMILSRLALFEH